MRLKKRLKNEVLQEVLSRAQDPFSIVATGELDAGKFADRVQNTEEVPVFYFVFTPSRKR